MFELIRPLSEQWGMTLAMVAALRTPERTGTWDVYSFKRSASGDWSHTLQTITRNPWAASGAPLCQIHRSPVSWWNGPPGGPRLSADLRQQLASLQARAADIRGYL